MNKYWKYFKCILEHKKNVFIECWKEKEYLHAFSHDLSKLSIKEFIPYAINFYSKKDCKRCKNFMNCDYNQIGLGSGKWAEECTSYKDLKFDKAWEHHYMTNKHHWNYWCYDHKLYKQGKSIEDCKLKEPNDMDYFNILHMICDWKGMARKFGDSAQEFYLKNYNKMNLSFFTRISVELELGLNDSPLHNYGHTLEQFANMYDKETYNSYFGYIKEKYKIDTYSLLKKEEV